MPSSSIEIEVKHKDAVRLNPRIGKASIRADELLRKCADNSGHTSRLDMHDPLIND